MQVMQHAFPKCKFISLIYSSFIFNSSLLGGGGWGWLTGTPCMVAANYSYEPMIKRQFAVNSFHDQQLDENCSFDSGKIAQ